MERRKLLADAEADRIRVTAAADADRMKSEAAILQSNPLLINKIVAERLSDKLQIMMVPADGKFFFANDVLRSMNTANHLSQTETEDSPKERGCNRAGAEEGNLIILGGCPRCVCVSGS